MNARMFVKSICSCGLLMVLLTAASLADAAISADTDGDGKLDSVSVCGSPAQVCIYHPTTGQTTYYRGPLWSSFSIDTVVDADGTAGAEVIVVWTSSTGSSKGIDSGIGRGRRILTSTVTTPTRLVPPPTPMDRLGPKL